MDEQDIQDANILSILFIHVKKLKGEEK